MENKADGISTNFKIKCGVKGKEMNIALEDEKKQKEFDECMIKVQSITSGLEDEKYAINNDISKEEI